MDDQTTTPSPVPNNEVTPSAPAPTPAPNPVATPPTIEPSESATPDSHPAPVTPPKAKHGSKAAIIGVVVALILASGAVFAYMKMNDNKTTPTTPTAATESTDQDNDVDQANKDIDATLNKVDDTTEFSETDLSDTTLGL